jgi:hypothetical protein
MFTQANGLACMGNARRPMAKRMMNLATCWPWRLLLKSGAGPCHTHFIDQIRPNSQPAWWILGSINLVYGVMIKLLSREFFFFFLCFGFSTKNHPTSFSLSITTHNLFLFSFCIFSGNRNWSQGLTCANKRPIIVPYPKTWFHSL